MIKNSNAAQSVESVETFLFQDLPIMVSGMGVGSSLLRGFGTNYLKGAFTRLTVDVGTQGIFKGFDRIDYRQATINSAIGVKGNSNYLQVGKIATANLLLNTANNVSTSYFRANGGWGNVANDGTQLSGKLVTGAIGNMVGIPGNTITGVIIPSFYNNGFDVFWNNY